MTDIQPNISANTIVTNPAVRKYAGNILGVASLVETIAVLVDVSIPQVDYAYITGPAGLIIAGLFGIFQLTVTSPNVPTAATGTVGVDTGIPTVPTE